LITGYTTLIDSLKIIGLCEPLKPNVDTD